MDGLNKPPHRLVLGGTQVDRHVGQRLQARRLMINMSEDWLAGRLDISTETLVEIEAGRVRISFEHLLIAADALDVTESYFYAGIGRAGSNATAARKSWIREVDRWFASQVFPHEGALLKMARRMTGNVETARDLVHETYADLMSGEKWRVIDNPRAYALKSVRSFAGRWLQRSRIVPFDLRANMESLDVADLDPNAFEVLSAKDQHRMILKAVAQLPQQCRRVVELRRFKDRSHSQIAEELGISLSMVEKHLARGMLLLAEALGKGDNTASPGGETRPLARDE